MAELARDAERRNAAAGERLEAYALLKQYIELLLAIDRTTLEDVAFWAAVRPSPGGYDRPRRLPYELALAPEVDLARGDLDVAIVVPYPLARVPAPGGTPAPR
jgi:hypothetical protein